MKKILVACGSGIVTSTTVNNKLTKILDENGFKGQYKIKQIQIGEAPGLSSDYDFLVATTQKPTNLRCDYVSGVPFLTGMGIKEVEKEIIALMTK